MAVRAIVTSSSERSYGAWDALFVALSAAHALALLLVPSVPLVAIGFWWNANTIAHNVIHRPFFRSRSRNRLFSVWLSAVLGVPQSLWRDRHLEHHRETVALPNCSALRRRRPPLPRDAYVELVAIVAVWTTCAWISPRVFFSIYVPGYAVGLAICFLQGHFEHAGGTTSHYGRLYNALFFNDGLHVEHHRRPGMHWSALSPDVRDVRRSRWPAVVRWLDAVNLDALERLVIRSPSLQRFVVDRHERAFRRMLPAVGPVTSVTIVGGGLFPRTAIVVRRLLPHAAITIVDASEAHLSIARPFLDPSVRTIHAPFDGTRHGRSDLMVFPLAYHGDRSRLYDDPPASRVFVHDWIWSRPSAGVAVSWLLLKRLNLVAKG